MQVVKANPILAILLWLLVAFALIVLFVRTPSLQFYTGGAIIALFVAALVYVWGNAIRQGNKMKNETVATPPPQVTETEESVPQKNEPASN